MDEPSREQHKRTRDQFETELSFLRQEEDRTPLKKSRSTDSILSSQANKRKRQQIESEESFLKQEEDRSKIKRHRSLSDLTSIPNRKRKRQQLESEETFLLAEQGRNKRFRSKSVDPVFPRQVYKRRRSQFESEFSFFQQEEDRTAIKRYRSLNSLLRFREAAKKEVARKRQLEITDESILRQERERKKSRRGVRPLVIQRTSTPIPGLHSRYQIPSYIHSSEPITNT